MTLAQLLISIGSNPQATHVGRRATGVVVKIHSGHCSGCLTEEDVLADDWEVLDEVQVERLGGDLRATEDALRHGKVLDLRLQEEKESATVGA